MSESGRWVEAMKEALQLQSEMIAKLQEKQLTHEAVVTHMMARVHEIEERLIAKADEDTIVGVSGQQYLPLVFAYPDLDQ